MRLTFDCAVVDDQSFLDGTRELTLEGEASEPGPRRPGSHATLRWPKDEAPDEGDLAVTGAEDATLYAGLEGGTIEEGTDDAGDSVLELALSFTIASAEGSLAGLSGSARVDGTIVGGGASLVVTAP
jgi:hypothetical protein